MNYERAARAMLKANKGTNVAHLYYLAIYCNCYSLRKGAWIDAVKRLCINEEGGFRARRLDLLAKAKAAWVSEPAAPA